VSAVGVTYRDHGCSSLRRLDLTTHLNLVLLVAKWRVLSGQRQLLDDRLAFASVINRIILVANLCQDQSLVKIRHGSHKHLHLLPIQEVVYRESRVEAIKGKQAEGMGMREREREQFM